MKKYANFLLDIGYCINISWKTSKIYTLTRVVFKILLSILPLISIFISSRILNILASNEADAISLFSVFLLVFLLVQLANLCCNKANEYITQIHDELLTNYINRIGIEKAANIDLSFYDSPACYDKLQLMQINSNSIKMILWSIIDLISNTISFLVAFLVLLNYSPIFSILLIISYIPVAVFDHIYIKKLYNWQTKNIGEERKMNYISNLVLKKDYSKSIRIFSISKYLLEKYIDVWKGWFGKRKGLIKKRSLVSLWLSSVPQILTIIVLFDVGKGVINHTNNIGDFSLYSGMISQAVSMILLITYSIVKISEDKLRISDFRDFLKWENKIEGNCGIEVTNINTIEFKNVSFKYPGNIDFTIKDFSLMINAKEKLALVGINGSGKSTLIKLLLRFYDVTSGEILINSLNINKYSLTSLRKCFSVLFQEYPNYAFSARENIIISDLNKKSTDDDIWEACKKSGADTIINRWKNGVDTFLYREFCEEGCELSGGENQKIALARMFYREGGIIIMDEPSSSIDPESEYYLFKKLLHLCENKGVILITHRLSNIVIADRIVVIENGVLIEDGTHEELIAKKGRYAELFQFQAEQYVKRA